MRALTGVGLLVVAGVVSGIGPDAREAPRVPPGPLSAWDSLIAEGESSYWEGEFDAARASWNVALERSRSAGDEVAQARTLTWLGLAAYRTGAHEEARRLGEEALTMKLRLGPGSEISRSYNALGLLAWTEGRLSEAASLFGNATAAARRENELDMLAKTANNLGLVFIDRGEFARARASLEESHAAGRRLGDPVIEGRSLGNLGSLEVQVGNPSAGVALLARARQRYAETGDVAGEANAMGQLAWAYTMVGEPGRAFAVLDSALLLARRHGMTTEVASSLDLLGDLYLRAGDRPKAIELTGQASGMYRDLGLTIEEGIDLARQAGIYLAMEDAGRARSLALEALALHRSSESVADEVADLLLLAEIEDRIGDEAASDRRVAEARTTARALDSRTARIGLALGAARIADRRSDPGTVLGLLDGAAADLRSAGYAELSESENLRARAHARLGDYEVAVIEGRKAVAAIERARGQLGSGFLRTSLYVDSRRPYADLVDALLHLARIEEAFEIVDGARGRAFEGQLASIPDRTARGDASIGWMVERDRSLREIDQLVRLRDEIETIPAEETGPEDRENARELTRKLDRARARYEELLVRGAESHSARSGLLEDRPIRATQIQRALALDEGLIEYFVTPERVLAFVVSRDGMEVLDLGMTEGDLTRRVAIARELAGTRPGSARPPPRGALESLHESLLAPLLRTAPLRRASRLAFVLDGPMASLPIAALRNPRTGRYLAESHALVVLPSASALPVLRTSDGGDARTASVTVYTPSPSDLPGTSAEARAIAASHTKTEVVAGSRATEKALRKELARGRVVHVASHGALESETPLFSRIELHRQGGDPDDDGRLEVHEVLGLKIRSPLVFLSGCETEPGTSARGALASGDEYATLARAFLYAGAGSVIATLWRIDDEAAALFAASFYRHLDEVESAEALVRAQRDMIRSGRYASPYYWAAYRLAGAPAGG